MQKQGDLTDPCSSEAAVGETSVFGLCRTRRINYVLTKNELLLSTVLLVQTGTNVGGAAPTGIARDCGGHSPPYAMCGR